MLLTPGSEEANLLQRGPVKETKQTNIASDQREIIRSTDRSSRIAARSQLTDDQIDHIVTIELSYT